MLGRIYVSGGLMGLIEFDDRERIESAAQKISNAYPNEPVTLRVGKGQAHRVAPTAGVKAVIFAPDLARKPRLQRQPR